MCVPASITFTIQLASGTLDRPTTRVAVLLDTDQNPSTGILEAPGLGADYSLDLDANSGQTAILKADPTGCAAHLSCFNSVSLTPITFTADAMQVMVPLSALGNADGRMVFQMHSYVLVAPLMPVVFDFMPLGNQPPGRVQ